MPHSVPLPDLLDHVLEAAQRLQLALEHDHAVAQHADRLVALDRALDHQAAGDRAELGAAEHVADLGDADDLLADFQPSRPEATCFTWSMTS